MKNFGKIGVVKFSDNHASAGSSERIPVWLNRDEEPHMVMSVDPRCHSNSAALDTNDKFTFTGAKPHAGRRKFHGTEGPRPCPKPLSSPACARPGCRRNRQPAAIRA